MAHLTIQYAPTVEDTIDIQSLCEALRVVMVEQQIFPVGGIRVRAWPTPHFAVADHHPENLYVDLHLRMGAGRTMEQKKAATAAASKTACS